MRPSLSAVFLGLAFGCGSGYGSYGSYGPSPASGAASGSASSGAAGSPFASCAASPVTGDFPLDVAAVLRGKCQTCHTSPPRSHAPFPLLNYEEVLSADPIAPYMGQPIWQVMHAVIQPGASPHMPLAGAPQLTSAEFQTLDGWLLACAIPVAEGTGGDQDATSQADAAPDSTPEGSADSTPDGASD